MKALHMSTLSIFLHALTDADLDRRLVFATIAGEVGAGYHITEFKLSDVKSIDCAARKSTWVEAAMQVLDGYGDEHMPVNKFKTIAEQSINALPDLAHAPLSVEFAPGNHGLGLYKIGAVQRTDTKLIVNLQPMAAVCKPSAGPTVTRQTNIEAFKSIGCC
ncbi:MAG: DUF6428 family protein [Pseudomonadota bacterium]